MDIQELKENIISQIRLNINHFFGKEPESVILDFPPDVSFGNFAFGCFALAKQFGQPPAEIAARIAAHFGQNAVVERAQAIGPYVNFKVSNKMFFETVYTNLINNGIAIKSEASPRVMLEYLSPNTNKPLHLGHLRNGALGMAIANILEATGCHVVKANLVNDRGVHICKSMLAWQKWGNGQTPESTGIKGDHFVGKWYIKYAIEAEKDPDLEEEIKTMLKRWEQSDPTILMLWEMMNNWVYEGFNTTYKQFGLEFDVFFYESQTYKLGKDIIQQGINKGIFQRTDKGGVIAELPIAEFGLDKKNQPKKTTLLRDNGTSVYMTQDLGTAVLKFHEYELDKSIYVVGSEQDYHFQVLFKLLDMLGYSWSKNCRHLSYGMVYLPEGKMKSREGKVVDADDLINEMKELAAAEIRKRDVEGILLEEDIKARANKIGVGAIKFFLLLVSPQKDIYFDPAASVSFDGCTGPYCQYTYARAKSMLTKAEKENISRDEPFDFTLLGQNEELLLAQRLIQLSDKLLAAVAEMNPACLAVQIHALAMAFNQFYQKIPVLGATDLTLINARLALVEAVAIALKQSLYLLGIEVLEEM